MPLATTSARGMNGDALVVDASALIDVIIPTERGDAVAAKINGQVLHAPAHVDVEILSALGRLERAGVLPAEQVADLLDLVRRMPLTRHALPGLLGAAWSRRHDTRLTDALYVALAEQLDLPLVTTDARLARSGSASTVVVTLE